MSFKMNSDCDSYILLNPLKREMVQEVTRSRDRIVRYTDYTKHGLTRFESIYFWGNLLWDIRKERMSEDKKLLIKQTHTYLTPHKSTSYIGVNVSIQGLCLQADDRSRDHVTRPSCTRKRSLHDVRFGMHASIPIPLYT